jgi:hypothetical protein
MGSPLQVAAAAVVLLLVSVVLVVVLRGRTASRRALAVSHAETELLRQRLETLEERAVTLERDSAELTRTFAGENASYLITDAGLEKPQPNVPDRVVLSATLGEPLVKVVAFGHGLARALSPESRNRIWFEMKREVRRARKQRRRETKQAWRAMRADQRASVDEAGDEAA